MESRHLRFWAIAVTVFLLDRITKFVVIKMIPLGASIDLLPFLSFTHIVNTGTAFGLFKNAHMFFMMFALAVSAFIIVEHQSFKKNTQMIAALVLGGALGNVVDRALYGAVIDFIRVPFWPAFNIADSAITIAIILLIVQEVRHEKQKI